MPSYILRPESDQKAEWTEVPGGAAWSCLDDSVTQPTAADTSDRVEVAVSDKFCRQDLTTVVIPETEAVTSLIGWFYCKAGSTVTITCSVLASSINYAASLSTVNQTSTSYGWVSAPYGGGLQQTQVDSLSVQALSVLGGGSNAEVAAMYVELVTGYLYWPNPQPGPQQ